MRPAEDMAGTAKMIPESQILEVVLKLKNLII